MAGVQPIRIKRFAVDVLASTKAALSAGKGVVHAPDYVTADSSGWCDAPIVLDEEGYGHWRGDSEPEGGWPSGQDGPARRLRRTLRRKAQGERERVWTSDRPDDWVPARTLSRQVRCRRCDGCRREKRCMWANKAVTEWHETAREGGRTWFVTLTFNPSEHYRLHATARQRLGALGGDLDALAWSDRYAELLHEYNREVDGFLDRLRKGLASRGWKPARFHYLAVPEPHKGAEIRVHYHVLLHEKTPPSGDFVPLNRRRIEQAWRGDLSGTTAKARGREARRDLGFVQAKLVPTPRDTAYTTKYLGKNHYEGRLRVSTGYGTVADREPEQDLKEPAPPPPMPSARRRLEEVLHGDTRAMLIGMVESREEDDDTDFVREGDYLGACPSGLHVGVQCDCEPSGEEIECVPVEFDELRGTPRRKWPLRGWHQTKRRGGGTEAGDSPVAGEPAMAGSEDGGTRH